MPIDIFDKEFQNWLKSVFGLNTTRDVLCKCMRAKIEDDVKDISRLELAQFFCCLKSNKIVNLQTKRKDVKQWECNHEKCRDLMDHFLNNHSVNYSLNYNWKRKEDGGIDNTELGHEGKNSTWNIVVLYMYVERNEPVEDYNSLDSLDISHLIKVMQNCKLMTEDGSAEPLFEVLESRNKVMHSPNNKMTEDETRNVLKWIKKLLDCLQISTEAYYMEAIEYIQDLEEKDFVIKYQSEEYKKVLSDVLEAKNMADDLYQGIGDEDQRLKRQGKILQEKLEMIGGYGSKSRKETCLEMKSTEYKSIIKDVLEKKQETIVLDKAECDEGSDTYKQLEVLEQKTVQEIQHVQEAMQKPEAEEMAEMIDSLNEKVTSLKIIEKQTKLSEKRLKKKTKEQAEKIDHLNKNVELIKKEKSEIEQEVAKYKKENESLKANTFVQMQNGNEHQLQPSIPIKEMVAENENTENLLTNFKPEAQMVDENKEGEFVKEDVKDYLDGYPDQQDDPDLNKNYDFFMNRIPSEPNGDYIDNIHVHWWGDYDRLEDDRKYMQWLFPVRTRSCNRRAQELFPHEIQEILKSEKAKHRLLTSYKMMLDFYGMKLENEEDGQIIRSESWKERYENLNRSKHNHNRITRMLKCLGELGFEHLKKNFTKFILIEIIEKKQLQDLLESCLNFWIGILKDNTERVEMKQFYEKLIGKNTE